MNLLFLYGGEILPTRGGVQRVTAVLADEFAQRGNGVFYLSLPTNVVGCGVDPLRQFYLPHKEFSSIENVSFLKEFLLKKKIDVLINQGGWSDKCSRLAYFARELGVPVFSVLHNGLLDIPRNYYEAHEEEWSCGWKRWFRFLLKNTVTRKLLCQIYIKKYRAHFRELCQKSDQVVLLSESVRSDLALYFPRNTLPSCVSAIPNPATFSCEDTMITRKQKELLWVGRMSFGQKRPDWMLKIWKMLEPLFPDWSLRFVGDGEYLPKLKKQSEEFGLRRVYFEGFQNPRKYYQQASIFCMTSTYEGFGMVLVEASAFGCIPIAFNSFSTVHDIISNGENGCLVPAFDLGKYAETLAALMRDVTLRKRIASSACQNVSQFSPACIVDQWEKLFSETSSLDN